MPSPVFEFGRFELDVNGYELRRAGRKVRLQRIPMELLILLVERKGALVTRDEISSRIWSADELVDTQSSINTAIRKIREALGDDGDKPRFVETVVGKGYRFAGAVSVREPPERAAAVAVREDANPVRAESPRLQPPPKQRGVALAVAGLAAAILISAIAVSILSRNQPQAEPMTVVPFTAVPGPQAWPALSPDGNQVAFGWTGETGDCSHIYVKTVGGAWPVKITDSGDCDSSPSWSRDGRWMAFLRKRPEGNLGLYVMPAFGGMRATSPP